MSWFPFPVLHLIALVIILIVIFLNINLRNSLFEMGVNFIYSYQTSQSSSFIRVIFNLFSLLGNTFFLIVVFVLAFILPHRKANAISYLAYMIINVYLIVIAKQAFQSTRPFW